MFLDSGQIDSLTEPQPDVSPDRLRLALTNFDASLNFPPTHEPEGLEPVQTTRKLTTSTANPYFKLKFPFPFSLPWMKL